MRFVWLATCLLIGGCTAEDPEQVPTEASVNETAGALYGLVIHGGAGTIDREDLDPATETAIRADLEAALAAGYALLDGGGEALDAVTAAITLLEDSPYFNAGKGAVYTAKETHELDSSIMDGRDLSAGAVAAVTNVRHPILLARRVLTDTPHVMLAGPGADEFARSTGLELVDNDYFDTDYRLGQLRRAQHKAQQKGARYDPLEFDNKFGTVGAAALDRNGNLAAGTSTGGMTNKRFGRVGDSPVVGAGTYANNASCAVSATGHGEYFIRNVVAYDICARMEYTGVTLAEAADQVVMQRLVERGGSGGIIAIDAKGNIALPFNTSGMYRGYRLANGVSGVAIFGDE